MKIKLLFIILPLIPIVIGIIFAIYFSVPRLKYTYIVEEDGYLVSYAYGDSKEYYIPETYNGKNVYGFSTRAFFRHKNLERIVIEKEENITFVGRLSFSECYNLKEISIRYAEVIEKNAFAYCLALEEIEVSSENIGGSAFFGCEALKKVTLNYGVTSLGSYTFGGCKSLNELVLPKSVAQVHINCFSYSGLKDLAVPSSLYDNSYIASLEYVRYY